MVIMILSAVFSVDKISSWLGFYGRFSDSVVGFLALAVMYFVVVNNVVIASKRSERGNLEESHGIASSSPAVTPRNDRESATPKKPWGLSAEKMVKLVFLASSIAVIAAYFSLFGLWAKIPGIPQVMTIRSFNPVAAPSEGLAMFLVGVISLIVGTLLSWRRPRLRSAEASPSNPKKSRKARRLPRFLSVRQAGLRPFAMTGLLLASLILLIIIDFRPAWLALGVTMLMLMIVAFWTRLLRKRVNLLLWPIILLIVAVIGWVSNFEQTFIKDVLGINPPPKEIILDYQTTNSVTWQTIKSSPILGSGPGTFFIDFTEFKPVEFNQNRFWNIRFDKGPSQLLEMVGTSGILGILSYLAIVVIFLLVVFMGLRRTKKKKAVEETPVEETPADVESPTSQTVGKRPTFQMLLPLFLFWIALLVVQIVYLGNTVIFFYFWLFMALGMVAWQEMRQVPAKKIVFSFKKLPEVGLAMNVILLILAFALIAVFYLGGRFYVADAKFNQPVTNNEEMIQNLEKVVNLNKYREGYRRALSQAYLTGAWAEVRKPPAEQRLPVLQSYASGAVQQARLATSISPNSVNTWEHLGIIYRDSRGLIGGTLPFALEAFSQGAELEPTNPFFYRELCRINLVTQEDWGKTLTYCQKAIELKENYLDAHIQLALVYESKGDLEEAVKQMEKTLDRLKGVTFQRGTGLARAATEIYFQLGRLYFNVNQMDKSVRMFEQAVIITPQYANPRYGLAVAYQIQGRLEDALIQFQIISQIVGSNPDVEARIRQLQALLAPVVPE